MILTQQEVSQLVERLYNCPPIGMYNYCDTSDRQKHFDSVRHRFSLIADELNSYFSGDEPPITFDPILKKYVELKRDIYLELYKILRESWPELKAEIEPIPDKPIDLLRGLVMLESIAAMMLAFPEDDLSTKRSTRKFSPRQTYQLRATGRKILAKNGMGFNDSQIEKYCTTVNQRMEFEYFWRQTEYRCLSIAEKKAKEQSRKSPLNCALLIYRELIAELDQYIHREMHPSKNPKGYMWHLGVKFPLS